LGLLVEAKSKTAEKSKIEWHSTLFWWLTVLPEGCSKPYDQDPHQYNGGGISSCKVKFCVFYWASELKLFIAGT
jgi:hypothetical protein